MKSPSSHVISTWTLAERLQGLIDCTKTATAVMFHTNYAARIGAPASSIGRLHANRETNQANAELDRIEREAGYA